MVVDIVLPSKKHLILHDTSDIDHRKYYLNTKGDLEKCVGQDVCYNLGILENTDNEVDYKKVKRVCYLNNRVAVVPLEKPSYLTVFIQTTGRWIWQSFYGCNEVLNLLSNRSQFIVCLENQIEFLNPNRPNSLKRITTPLNPRGVCAVSLNEDKPLLAYPRSDFIGDVQIYEIKEMKKGTRVLAHETSLAAMAFSPCGTKIATASDRGICIRISSTENGQKLHEFVRGVTRCVEISSLVFSPCGNYLGCSSDTKLAHIFKLEGEDKYKPECDFQKDVNDVILKLCSMKLPTFAEVTTKKAFAVARLPTNSKKAITITSMQDNLYLLVVDEKALCIYRICPNKGGDLELFKKYKFNQPDSDEKMTSNLQEEDSD